MTTATSTTTQVYRVWIKAAPEKIWQAIVDPEWNTRYGYAAPGFYDLKPGGSYRSTPNEGMIQYARENGFPMPETIVDGEVVEVVREAGRGWEVVSWDFGFPDEYAPFRMFTPPGG